MRERVFARDREPQPRAFDAAVARRLALVERVEDALALCGIDAVALVDDVEHREAVRSIARSTVDRPDRGEYLMAFETRLSTIVRIFSASPTTSAGFELRLERDHPRERGELVLLARTRRTHVRQRHRPERLRLHRPRLVVSEQVLDQLLQRQRVLADDADDLALLRRELAADVVAQELGALAHGGERRLELVRDVPQEAVLLLLELATGASAAIRGAGRGSAGPAGR